MLAAIHIQWVVGVIFIILYSVTILGLVLVIIAENRNPLKTIPWVIVLLLAPGIGLLFYFFFGQDNRKQRIISRRTYKRIMKRPQEGKLPQDACTVPGPYQPLVTLLSNNNQSSLLYGSEIKIYTNSRIYWTIYKRQNIISTFNIISFVTMKSGHGSKTP